MTNLVSLPAVYCMQIIPLLLDSCNTSSFLTHPSPASQLKNLQFFWSTFRSVQVSSAYKDVLQMYHFTSFLRTFKRNLLERNYFNFVLRTCQKAGFYPDVYRRMQPPGSRFVWLTNHTVVILSEILY
jgi:hypothetical protein